MKLSAKAVRFVIDALEHYQKFLEQRLSERALSEDEVSELSNDREFLAAIKNDFEKHGNELAAPRDRVKAL
jgi:recombinational DNA repair ATPase RecF